MQHETERGFFGPGTEPQRAHRSTGRRRGPGRFGAHGTAVRAAERGRFVGADPACGRILAAVAGVPAGMDDRAAALAAGGACPYCPAGTRRLPGGIPLHGAARRAAAAALGRGTACVRQLERGCTGAVVVLGLVLCLPGLLGQMHWARLVAADAARPVRSVQALVYAEYFFGPPQCAGKTPKHLLGLPWLAFAVQAAAWLGMGLVFGAGDYPQRELLRAWSAGVFSRLDALLLLVWLACAFYRIGFLCTALRTCLCGTAPAGKGAAE